MRKIAALVSILVMAVIAAVSYVQAADVTPPVEPMKPVPAAAFKLTDIKGKEVSLAKYKGKVIILDFWATWCPPCRAEIPDFVALQKQYGKKGLVVIGLSLDRDSEKSDAKTVVSDFCKKNKINYPVAIVDKTVADSYGGIQYIPTTFIINRAGMIVQKYVGGQKREVFENDIKPLLAEKAPRK